MSLAHDTQCPLQDRDKEKDKDPDIQTASRPDQTRDFILTDLILKLEFQLQRVPVSLFFSGEGEDDENDEDDEDEYQVMKVLK